MSSRTFRSRLWYAAFAAAGGTAAYLRFGVWRNEARYSDFPDFDRHFNLMSRTLTKSVYDGLKRTISPSGFTLDRCIQPGIDVPGDVLLGNRDPGVVAGDVECYELFRDVFDGVLAELYPERKEHERSLTALRRPDPNLLSASPYVKEITVTAFRNLTDAPFTPAVSRAQRRLVEKQVADALSRGAYGSYTRLPDLPREQTGIMTKPAAEQDRVAGVTRDWPDSRGVLKQRGLEVRVNGRHHLEVTAKDTNIAAAAKSLADAVVGIEQNLPDGICYVWTPKLGYPGHDLKQIGNALSLNALVSLPKFGTHPDFIKGLKKCGLRPVPNPGEKQGTWELTLAPSFDTEADHLKRFAGALSQLIRAEEELRATGKVTL